MVSFSPKITRATSKSQPSEAECGPNIVNNTMTRVQYVWNLFFWVLWKLWDLGEKNPHERFKVICQCRSWQTRVRSMCTFSSFGRVWADAVSTGDLTPWTLVLLEELWFSLLNEAPALHHSVADAVENLFFFFTGNQLVSHCTFRTHAHTHLYLLPSELPIQLQQELNRLVCCFALLFLKAKLDIRLLGNWGCTSLLHNEQVQMSLRGFSRTCVFPPFAKWAV